VGERQQRENNIGLIAQSIQPYIPYAVEQMEDQKLYINGVKTDILNLNTHPIMFLLINAVKELNARIEQLEGELYDRSIKISKA
jgi:sporulation-control protein spo0M